MGQSFTSMYVNTHRNTNTQHKYKVNFADEFEMRCKDKVVVEMGQCFTCMYVYTHRNTNTQHKYKVNFADEFEMRCKEWRLLRKWRKSWPETPHKILSLQCINYTERYIIQPAR